MAAFKSPLARASLIETRKLIAEATRSIESTESGQLTPYIGGDVASFPSDAPTNCFPTSSHESDNIEMGLDKRLANGSHLVSSDFKAYEPSDQGKYEGFDIDRFTLQNALETGATLPSTRDTEGGSGGDHSDHTQHLPSFEPTTVKADSSLEDFQGGQPKINGSIQLKEMPSSQKDGTLVSKESEETTRATKTRKWVCGRLVEVDD